MEHPLRRPSAGFRRALCWAQLALAVGVVLAAVAVGHLVQSQVVARAAAPVTSELQEVVGPSVTGAGAVGDGSLAALGVLLVGWTLVACAGTVGRRRVEEWESARWAAGWARVEPVWSGRVSEGS